MRCNPRLRFRFLRCLVALAAVVSDVAIVTQRLKAEHAALPVGRAATRRAARHVGQLARRCQVAGNGPRTSCNESREMLTA